MVATGLTVGCQSVPESGYIESSVAEVDARLTDETCIQMGLSWGHSWPNIEPNNVYGTIGSCIAG